MLESDKQRVVARSHHEGVHVGVGRRAGPLAAEVQEDWPDAVPKLVINPESLIVVQVVLRIGVKVVYFV